METVENEPHVPPFPLRLENSANNGRVSHSSHNLCGWIDRAEEKDNTDCVATALRHGGKDPRVYSIMTRRFIGHNSVEAVETAGVNSSFSEVPATTQVWPSQLVLLATGFFGPEQEGLVAQLGLMLNARGVVPVDENQMTSVPGVFAVGDIERGQSLVVWAIADGRKAAAGVDAYLR